MEDSVCYCRMCLECVISVVMKATGFSPAIPTFSNLGQDTSVYFSVFILSWAK